VPAYILEKISELFITDLWKINNKYFIQNIDENGGVSNFWKVEDSETANLVVAEIPIRERYMGQNALVVATPTPDLELYTSPGFPYAVCPWTLATGEVSVPFTHTIIEDLAGETAQIAAWNVTLASGGALGTIVRTSGVLYYVPSGDTPFLPVPIRLLTKIVHIVYYREPLGGGAGYLVAGVSGVHVFDWGDATAPTYVTVTGGSIYPQTHTYAASVGADYACRMFHDDTVGGIYFIETGVYYPSPCKFVDITGELPTGLFVLTIINCNFFGSLGLSIDLSPCVILADLIIRNCPLIPNFAGVFNYPNPLLSEILLGGNPLSSGGVDGVFIDFVANTWDGVLSGGLIGIQCSPPQPPTAASLSARNALLAKGWTFFID
jgi:hypothetical protein